MHIVPISAYTLWQLCSQLICAVCITKFVEMYMPSVCYYNVNISLWEKCLRIWSQYFTLLIIYVDLQNVCIILRSSETLRHCLQKLVHASDRNSKTTYNKTTPRVQFLVMILSNMNISFRQPDGTSINNNLFTWKKKKKKTCHMI